MKTSELIAKLQDLVEEFGDLEVATEVTDLAIPVTGAYLGKLEPTNDYFIVVDVTAPALGPDRR